MIKIQRVRAPKKEDLAAINNLIRQLSPNTKPLTFTAYGRLLARLDYVLMAARDNGRMVGMASIVFFRIPVGFRSHFEDVVVSEEYRGQGIGEKLCRALIVLAKKKGAGMIDLTSRPHRIPAHKMYEKLGFEQQETKVYRLRL